MADQSANPAIEVPSTSNVTPLYSPQAGPISFNLENTFRSPITWMVIGAVAMVFVMKWLKSHN